MDTSRRRSLRDWVLTMGPGSASVQLPDGVQFLHRGEDERTGVLLTADLGTDAGTALFDGGRVFAVAGGEPLVRWLPRDRWPDGLTTIALRDVAPEVLAELVDAPVLAHVRSLCVRDAPARSAVLARLLASAWASLESLAIYDATPLTVASIPRELLGRLGTLRIVGAYGEPTSIELSALGGPHLGELELAQLALSSPTLEALADSDWSGLHRLLIGSCALERGGEALASARFPALRELVSTGFAWDRPRSLGDAAVAGIVSRSPRLERAILTHSDAGDAAAIAAATHGASMRVVDLDRTRVGDAGIVALGRSTVLVGLEHFAFDQPLSFDAAYALADSSSRAMRDEARRPYRGLYTLFSWRPRARPPSAPTDGPWPLSPVQRRFKWQRHEDCSLCGGSGTTGADGRCPWHSETVVFPVERGDEPPTDAARAWIASSGERVTAIEQHGVDMLAALSAWGRWRGEPRVTWWVLDRIHRGCDQDPMKAPPSFRDIIEAVGAPEMSDRGVWAHACARARARDYPQLPDPFTPARAIADLGTSIIGLDEADGIVLALRTQP